MEVLPYWGIKNKQLILDIFSSEPYSWQAYKNSHKSQLLESYLFCGQEGGPAVKWKLTI
jgi:hypothetical protein